MGTVRTRSQSVRSAVGPVALAVGGAIAAVALLRPRRGVPEPLPVDVHDHFSREEIARARRYRRGQLAIFAASTAVESGALVALARGAGPRLPRNPAAAGAALSVGLGLATLP